MRWQTAAAAISMLLLVLSLMVASTSAAATTVPGENPSQLYIVELKELPVAVHLALSSSSSSSATTAAAATPSSSSGRGRSVSLSSVAAAEHAGFISTQAQSVASRAMGDQAQGKVRSIYRYAFAGFAAGPLSSQEVAALAADPAVAQVRPAATLKVQTITSPTFLGMTTPGGAWSLVGGPDAAGRDVVIGMLDTGVFPENPLFDDQGLGPVPPHFKGSCSGGRGFPATTCNNKIVGCKYFTAGFEGFNLTEMIPYEYESCRDAFGHGTHTSATAAGGWGVASPYAALPGNMSGLAPAARIAVYKVCWGKSAGNFCNEVDILAGIEAATVDQVDVINYSLGGSLKYSRLSDNAISVAMRGAAAAGIFVAASAGNDGPVVGSVDNLSPWITTVAASTHDRQGLRQLQLGNGEVFTGSGLVSPTRWAEVAAAKPVPLVLAEAAVLPEVSTQISKLCLEDTLDPAKVAGKIVVCERGAIERWEKSRAVKAARGVGMVLLNTGPEGTANDLHYVPTVHLSHTHREAVRRYAATPGATASLPAASVLSGAATAAPEVAEFSARGPAQVAGGQLLKPDITAPGVDILSASSPPGSDGRRFDLSSGTSMSSPAIAGIAAVIRSRHPSWTPMMVKSAIMTTARQTTNSGAASPSLSDPFAAGAGHVDPTSALNPGLVLDSGVEDWQNFLCGRGEVPRSQWAASCPACLAASAACDPANLNLPSVSLPAFVGRQTVQRRLTSVLDEPADFSVAVEHSAGFTVSATPETFRLAPHETQVVNITVAYVPGSAFGKWAKGGAVSWKSSSGTTTRIPIVARARETRIPSSVRFKGDEAQLSYSISTAHSGQLSAQAVGLTASRVFTGRVKAAGSTFFEPGQPGAAAVEVVVPEPAEGWMFARFSMFDGEPEAASQPRNDLDLYLYKDGQRIAAGAAANTSAAAVDVMRAAGRYTAYVHGFDVPAGEAGFVLHVHLLHVSTNGSSSGSLHASLASPDTGGQAGSISAGVPLPVTLQLDRQNLRPGKRYLGLVTLRYSGSHGEAALGQLDDVTVVTLDT